MDITLKFSEMGETQEPILRVPAIVPDGMGGFNNVITDDRYVPTVMEYTDLTNTLANKVSNTLKINGYPLDEDLSLLASDVGAIGADYVPVIEALNDIVDEGKRAIEQINISLLNKVNNSRTVNGKPLTADITLNAVDVGALNANYAAQITQLDTDVSKLKSDSVLVNANLGALNLEVTKKVNSTRTVNGYPLTSDVQLTYTDVHALGSSYAQVIDSMLSDITQLAVMVANHSGLIPTKVDKTTTVNGYPLSANVRLGYSDVQAYPMSGGTLGGNLNTTGSITAGAITLDGDGAVIKVNSPAGKHAYMSSYVGDTLDWSIGKTSKLNDYLTVSCYSLDTHLQLTPTGIQSNKGFTATGDITGTKFIGPLQGNADTATKLNTPRTLTIGNTDKEFDGSANVAWTISEIGAVSKLGDTISGDLTVNGKTITTGFELHSATGLASTVKSTVGGVESWVLGKLTGTNDLTLRSSAHGVELNFTSTGATLNRPLTVTGQVQSTRFTGPLTGAVTGNADTATKLKDPVTVTIGNTAKSFDGSGNVAWTVSDIGAVPPTRTVNTKPLSADVVLTPADIGALPSSYSATIAALDGKVAVLTNEVKDNATQLGLKVDKTTTVNTKPLSGNVVLNAADVGALGNEYNDFLTLLGAELMQVASDVSDGVQDRNTILNYMFDHIFPRLLAIEKIVGIDSGGDVNLPGTPRPKVTWEHETWNGDNQTVYFSTNDIPFGYMSPEYYDVASAGLRENPDVMNSGTGWAQYNWGFSRTVVRVYKSDLKGWSDNLSKEVRVILFQNFWLSNIPWEGHL